MSAQPIIKDYLGDSVYAQWTGTELILTTENGSRPSNVIILEPSVIAALERYMNRIKEQVAAP